MRNIHSVLDKNGVWVFEQSYLLSMLEANAYDTVCHEHLEYYALRQIKWMCEKIGFKIIDIEIYRLNPSGLLQMNWKLAHLLDVLRFFL